MSVSNKIVYTRLGFLAVLSLVMLIAPDFAHAGTNAGASGIDGIDVSDDGSDIFGDLLGLLVGWITGAMGKFFAITFFIIGAGLSFFRQNLVFVAGGAGMAILMAYGPSFLLRIFSATVPLQSLVA